MDESELNEKPVKIDRRKRPRPPVFRGPVTREVSYDDTKKIRDYRLTTDRYIRDFNELTPDDLEFAIRNHIKTLNRKFHKNVIKERNSSLDKYSNDINSQAGTMYRDWIKNLIVLCVEKHGSFSEWCSHAKACGVTVNPLSFSKSVSSQYKTIHIHLFLLCAIASGISIVDLVSGVDYLRYDPAIHLIRTPKEKKPKKAPAIKRIKTRGFRLARW